MSISHTNITLSIQDIPGLQPVNDIVNNMVADSGFEYMVSTTLGKVDIKLNEAAAGGDDNHIVKCEFSIATGDADVDVTTANLKRNGDARTETGTTANPDTGSTNIHEDIMCEAYKFSGETAPSLAAITNTFTSTSRSTFSTKINEKTEAKIDALRTLITTTPLYIKVMIDESNTTPSMKFYTTITAGVVSDEVTASSSDHYKMMVHMLNIWNGAANNLGTAMQSAMNSNADVNVTDIMGSNKTSVMVTPHVLDSISNGSPLSNFGVLINWTA